jgi:hypothetical protein
VDTRILTITIAAFCISTTSIQAAEVSGTFRGGESTIEPANVAAVQTRKEINASIHGTAIFLTEVPIEVQEAAMSLNPVMHLQNLPELMDDASYIIVWVFEDNDVHFNATLAEGNMQFVLSSKDGLKSEITDQSGDHIAGRVWTEEPIAIHSGGSYAIDVTFSTPIVIASGSPLAADGGEPGKALQELAEALKGGEWAAIRPYLNAEKLGDLDDDSYDDQERVEEAQSNFPDWMQTGKLDIRGGVLRKDEAVLEVRAEEFTNFWTIQGVRMIKEDSGWIMDDADSLGMSREK